MSLPLARTHRLMLSPIYSLCDGSAAAGMKHINELSKWVASEGIQCALPPAIFDVVLEYHPVDFFELSEIVLHNATQDSQASAPAQVLIFATTELPVAEQYSSYNTAAQPVQGRRRRGTATRNLHADVTVQSGDLKPIAKFGSFTEPVTKVTLESRVTAKFLLIKILPAKGAGATSLQHITFKGRHVLEQEGAAAASPAPAVGSTRPRHEGPLGRGELAETMERFALFSAAFEFQLDHLAVLLQMGAASPLLNLLIECHLRMCSVAPTLSKYRAGASFSFNAPGRRNSVFESRNNYQAINMANSKCITHFVVTTIIANCPKLLSINLEGCPYITDRAVEALAKHCRNLGKVYLAGCNQLTETSLMAVVNNCPGLSEFSMWELDGDQHEMQRLAGFTKLQSLSIPNNGGLTDKLLSHILKKTRVLEELKLPNCTQMTDKGLKAVAKYCKQLALLDVSGNVRLTDEGMAALSRLPALRSLMAGGLRVTDAAVVDLALYHGDVTAWDLSHCSNLTNAAICTLAANIPTLTAVDLSGVTDVAESALLYLATCGHALAEVTLENTKTTDTLVHMLVTGHKRLASLNLSHCPNITDASLRTLCSSKALEKLSVCGSSRIKCYALLQLLQNCTSLKTLDVTGCANVTEIYVIRMKNAAPHVDILFKDDDDAASSPAAASVSVVSHLESHADLRTSGGAGPRIDRMSERVISSRRLSTRRSSTTISQQQLKKK